MKLADYLDDLILNGPKRLAISCPPCSGKSWAAERNVAHALTRPGLSASVSRMNPELTDHLAWQIQTDYDCDLSGLHHLPVGHHATGRSFDLMFFDDIDQRSGRVDPAYLRKVWQWFESVAGSRIRPGGRIVVIGSRCHAHDPIGRILAGHAGEDWTVINVPAIAHTQSDPLGRKFGEALDGEEVGRGLRQARAEGAHRWSTVYQGHPPDDGFPMIEAAPTA